MMKKYLSMVLTIIILLFVFREIVIIKGKAHSAISSKILGQHPKAEKTVSLEDSANKVLNFVNEYFVPEKNAVISGKVVEESGLLKVSISVDDKPVFFYTTKDGALLFLPNSMIDIAKYKESAKKEEVNKEIEKTEKPTIELFVMSLCPYGIKAEQEIMSVINDFGDKLNFHIKFIVNVKGGNIEEVDSLHGKDESREDARQIAVMQFYPDKFTSYLDKISENSCVISCGAVKLEDYWKKVAKGLKMDIKKIESFAYGKDCLNILKENESSAEKYQANASPTLIINGMKSDSIYKGKSAIKEAICSAYVNPPNLCKNDEGVGL